MASKSQVAQIYLACKDDDINASPGQLKYEACAPLVKPKKLD